MLLCDYLKIKSLKKASINISLAFEFRPINPQMDNLLKSGRCRNVFAIHLFWFPKIYWDIALISGHCTCKLFRALCDITVWNIMWHRHVQWKKTLPDKNVITVWLLHVKKCVILVWSGENTSGACLFLRDHELLTCVVYCKARKTRETIDLTASETWWISNIIASTDMSSAL